MQAIFFNHYQFEKIKKKKLLLDKSIRHVESELYLTSEPLKYHNQYTKLLLKKFYITEGEYFSNKLFTINRLIDLKDKIDIKPLILPTKMVVLEGKMVGYLMPYIEGVNLLTLLQSYNVDTETKIAFLEEIGIIIEKVHYFSKFQEEFSLGDIHEANFIVDCHNQIHVTDLDSCKLKNNLPSASKYLSTNPNLEIVKEKYPINEQGIHIPNYNSDIYCYICMILNTIAKTDVSKLPLDDYYTYLQYLSNLGFGKELIHCFATIYIHQNNISPQPYLHQIPTKIGEAAYHVFQYKENKKIR